MSVVLSEGCQPGANARMTSVNAAALPKPYAPRLSRELTSSAPSGERIIELAPNAVSPRSSASARKPSTTIPRAEMSTATHTGIQPKHANAIQYVIPTTRAPRMPNTAPACDGSWRHPAVPRVHPDEQQREKRRADVDLPPLPTKHGHGEEGEQRAQHGDQVCHGLDSGIGGRDCPPLWYPAPRPMFLARQPGTPLDSGIGPKSHSGGAVRQPHFE